MKKNKLKNLSFKELLDLFIKFLESKAYSKQTLINYLRILRKIEFYMDSYSISDYSEKVGLEYYYHYIQKHKVKTSRKSAIYNTIRRFNDFYLGNEYTIQHPQETKLLPNNYEEILLKYAHHCYKSGNKDNTIKSKCQFIRSFLKDCISQGCSDIVSLNPSYVVKACLHVKNKDGWAAIRAFLRYINTCGIQKSDFSTLIPCYKRPINIPVTYTEEEISKLENEIDQESDIGKRDYALILLATRLGMRSGDIINLTLDQLDFVNNTISFVQQKTGETQHLPMLPVIREALLTYISIRPKETGEFVFLRHNAPFTQITTSVIRFEVTQYFKKAGIDIANKKHGPHVFRASLANSMINNDVPYETVRKILGHISSDSIKHYARLDIEKLRECSIEVPEPSSSFKTFLEGDV